MIIGNLPNGDGNENVHKFIHLVAKNEHFSLLSISLSSSAKQQREIAIFEVLSRTSALEDEFSFSSLN